jgi:Transposase domain (DUF772)
VRVRGRDQPSAGVALGKTGVVDRAACASTGCKGDRPPFAVERTLRDHFLQKWFSLSGSAIGEALYDTPMFRRFVGLDAGDDNLPGESTILRFRHLPKTQILSLQILAMVNDETQVHALV